VSPNRPPKWLLPAVASVMILAPCAYSVGRFAWSRMFAAPKPFLEVPSAPTQRCVRDAVWMRQNHMVFLKELRDKTVREGIRNEITLSSCSQCHKDKAKFCDKCHNAVNLHPDCFNCHSYSTTDRPVLLIGGKP
jgi:hypothetical protein